MVLMVMIRAVSLLKEFNSEQDNQESTPDLDFNNLSYCFYNRLDHISPCSKASPANIPIV